MDSTTAGREIVVTRLIDAPRELVFAAFTEQEHVMNWWVPGGTTTHEWSAQPGGLWRYTMPIPESEPMPFRVQFIEIAPPGRLVYDYGMDAADAPEPVRTHVTFEEQANKTRVTLRLVFATAAERDEAAQYGAAGGAQQALGSLAQYVTGL